MTAITDVEFYDTFRNLCTAGAVPHTPESFERAADTLADGLANGSIVVDEEVRAEYGADWVSELSATAGRMRFEQSRRGIAQPAFTRGCAPDLYVGGFCSRGENATVYVEVFVLDRPVSVGGIRVHDDTYSHRAWPTWLRADEAAALSECGTFHREWIVSNLEPLA